MTDTTSAPALLPCPWCAAGTTVLKENGKVWMGMRWSEPASVSVQHWCEPFAGQPSRLVERVGRDLQSALAAWNTRAQPDHTALLRQALEALELGRDALSELAALFHAAMAGYKPKRHAAMDADVAQAEAAIAALRSALDSSTTGGRDGN